MLADSNRFFLGVVDSNRYLSINSNKSFT